LLALGAERRSHDGVGLLCTIRYDIIMYLLCVSGIFDQLP
jgi:hypothetical protein